MTKIDKKTIISILDDIEMKASDISEVGFAENIAGIGEKGYEIEKSVKNLRIFLGIEEEEK